MHRGTSWSPLRWAVGLAISLWASAPAVAQGQWGTIRFDQWLFVQGNANDSTQWQYRPRLFLPYDFASGWTATMRIDLPMLYTNDSGPAHPGGGYSGGIGNYFIEPTVDTPEVSENLRLRASLLLIAPSPNGAPFGNGTQYQAVPGFGATWRQPDMWRGVTFTPYVRYARGFNVQAGATAVDSLWLYPGATIGLAPDWSLQLYPENPITYDYNTGTWFVPLDLLLVYRLNKEVEFGLGGAIKLGSPSNPSYDHIVDARVTFNF